MTDEDDTPILLEDFNSEPPFIDEAKVLPAATPESQLPTQPKTIDPQLREILRQDIKMYNDSIALTYQAASQCRYPGELLAVAKMMQGAIEAKRKMLLLPYGEPKAPKVEEDKPKGWGYDPV